MILDDTHTNIFFEFGTQHTSYKFILFYRLQFINNEKQTRLINQYSAGFALHFYISSPQEHINETGTVFGEC